MDAGGWGTGGNCFVGTGFCFRVIQMFWDEIAVVAQYHECAKCLRIVHLRWFTLCDTKFASIKRTRKYYWRRILKEEGLRQKTV